MVINLAGELDPLYARALELARNQTTSTGNIGRVAKATSEMASRWAFTQWTLRKRGAAKFEKSGSMLFDREALEQATHEAVSAYRASRFPRGMVVLDGTCSLGGDLIALAQRGPAVGLDLNIQRMGLAAWNLKVHDTNAQLACKDCLEAEAPDGFAFFDPARRTNGRRTLNIDDFLPNPYAVIDRFADLKLGMMKLSPLLRDEALQELGQGVEFWSYGRECKEATVSFGESVLEGVRAVHIESGEVLASGPDPYCTVEVGAFFYDVDPACVRAHAIGTLADSLGLESFGDALGYLTGPTRLSSPWLRAYEVLDCLPGRMEKTTQHFKSHGMFSRTIKTRSAAVDVEKLKQAWRNTGDKEVTVAVVTVEKRIMHLILKEGSHSP